MVQIAGFLSLAYVLAVTLVEWRSATTSRESLERARAAVALSVRAVDDERRLLEKTPDLLEATASIESSPARVLKDIDELVPEGVSITGLKIEYAAEGTARLDFTVVARTPFAYDRFLAALSRSKRFGGIKPGSESRPGLVRATVLAIHRPVDAPSEGGAR
jgi:hypothetical protein